MNPRISIILIIALLFVVPCMAAEGCASTVSMGNTTFEGVVNWSDLAPLDLDHAAKEINISEKNNAVVKQMIENYHFRNRGYVSVFKEGKFDQLITSNGTFYNISVQNTDPWNVSCLNVVHFVIDDMDTKAIDHIEVFVIYDSEMENILAISWSYDENINTSFVFPTMGGGDSAGGSECSSSGPSGGGGGSGGGGPSGSSAGSEGTASSVSSGDAGGGW